MLRLPVPPAPLTIQHPTGGILRKPQPEETELLAEVMLDAYLDTVDYEGETTDDALVEVEGYFSGRTGEPLLEASWVYESSGAILSASLVSLWKGKPLVSFLMTRSAWKGRGLASYVLRQSLLSLQDAGYGEVYATISEGNEPSQEIFSHFGFERVE
jgi:GNAT superfamily N-acetyltransferase